MDGNKNQDTSDLLEVFLVSQDKTMEKTHVADVCRVLSINGNQARLQLVNRPKVNTFAYIPNSISVDVDDYVLVLYTDLDTRNNIKMIEKARANNSIAELKEVSLETTKHTIDNGIIILKI